MFYPAMVQHGPIHNTHITLSPSLTVQVIMSSLRSPPPPPSPLGATVGAEGKHVTIYATSVGLKPFETSTTSEQTTTPSESNIFWWHCGEISQCIFNEK